MEVRIAGADDRVAHQLTGDAVIGMEPVALPRVMAEHDVGAEAANRPDDLGSRGHVVRQLAVDAAEKEDLARLGAGQSPGRLPLLLLSPVDERRLIGIRVPGALRAVRAHEVMDHAPLGGPLGQGAARSELDVVRVGADGQGTLR